MLYQIKEITPEERHWLLVAVAQILIADHVYENSEKDFFEDMMKQIFHREAAEMGEDIKKILDGTSLAPIESFTIDNPKHLVVFLDVLSAAVYASGKMLHSESLKFFEAGTCLGFAPGTLSYRLNLEGEHVRAQKKLSSFRQQLEDELHQKAKVKP